MEEQRHNNTEEYRFSIDINEKLVLLSSMFEFTKGSGIAWRLRYSLFSLRLSAHSWRFVAGYRLSLVIPWIEIPNI